MVDRFHTVSINKGDTVCLRIDVVLPEEHILRSFFRNIVANPGSKGAGAFQEDAKGFLERLFLCKQLFMRLTGC